MEYYMTNKEDSDKKGEVYLYDNEFINYIPK
jgi:hypothetical protein